MASVAGFHREEHGESGPVILSEKMRLMGTLVNGSGREGRERSDGAKMTKVSGKAPRGRPGEVVTNAR